MTEMTRRGHQEIDASKGGCGGLWFDVYFRDMFDKELAGMLREDKRKLEKARRERVLRTSTARYFAPPDAITFTS